LEGLRSVFNFPELTAAAVGWRSCAGRYFTASKKTRFELYYMIEDNFNINNPPVNYVMGVELEREF
jgi:hypothetical protein